MKPIKLEITGLQSFSKKQTIDFESLTSLGLFGIFGETGSGKSTILDAIIFSIFDQIPRTMGNTGKNIRSSLNNDSDILEVYFKFCLGEDIFEITRTYKKKYSRKGEEKFEQANPIMIKNGDVIADTVKNVEVKVKDYFGIGVNDFTRSVVLPQGKFSDFLKLKGAEKMTMLENIFELEKYGTKMSDKISARLSILKDEITSLENQIKGKGDFTLQLQGDLETVLKSKQHELQHLTLQKKDLNVDFLSMSDLKTQYEKLNSYIYELDKLAQSEEFITSEKQKVNQHNEAIIFKSTIDEIFSIETNADNEKKEALSLQHSYEKENEELTILKTSEVKKQSEIDEIEMTLKNSSIDYDELENLRKFQNCHSTLLIKERFLTESKSIYDNLMKENEELKIKLSGDENELNIEKQLLSNLLQNSEKFKDISIQDFENEIQELKTEISITENEIKNKKVIEDELLKLSEGRDIKNHELNTLTQELTKLQNQNFKNRAFEISKNLVHGENCPVCGSKDHPHPAQNTDSVDSNELEVLLKTEEQLKNSILELNIKISHSEESLSKLKNLKDIDALNSILNEKENVLDVLKNRIKEISIEEKKIESKIAVLESTISNTLENIDKKEREIDFNFEKISSYQFEVKVEREKIESLNLNQISAEDASERKILLENTEREFRLSSEIKSNLDLQIREIKDEILNKSNHVQETLLNLTKKNEKINSLIEIFELKNETLKKESLQKGFKSNEDILEAILTEDILKDSIQSINYYDDNIIKYNHLKDEINLSIGDREFILESWQSLSLKIEEVNTLVKDLVKEVTELSSDLDRIQKLADEARELLIQIEKLVSQQDELLLLQKKFKGRKFVNFLARKRLDYIAFEASRRLQKVTRGRYRLTVDKYCDFNIVDAFNSNYTRDCATLSGGETFIVSLVLALALSSQLQLKGNVQLEFFFLDEGFGTLDSILLDRVIEILEEIGWKEKMKIGIISHVEDLKLRIPRRLEVSPAVPGEAGSIVKLL
ncbi:MAG: AAA family ATPase [Cetobacterium sp.]